jgi:hypothetical protein
MNVGALPTHAGPYLLMFQNLTTPILHGVRPGGQAKDELGRASRIMLDFDFGVHFDAASLGLGSCSWVILAYGIDSKHDYD